MLYLYLGTDRDRARAAMGKAVAAWVKKTRATVVRITDANRIEDMQAALQGGGMFGVAQAVVLDGVCATAEMREALLATLPFLASADDPFFLYEKKPDAATKKILERYAAAVERFDVARKAEDKTIFALASALKRRDKKNLWIGYLREVGKGTAPEAIHGMLFWAAKSMLLEAGRDEIARTRAESLVALLAQLPHEARRSGFDLEYALERFAISGA